MKKGKIQFQKTDIIYFTDDFGETRKLVVFKQNKTSAMTDKGVWDFHYCLACFLGKTNQCLGACVNKK